MPSPMSTITCPFYFNLCTIRRLKTRSDLAIIWVMSNFSANWWTGQLEAQSRHKEAMLRPSSSLPFLLTYYIYLRFAQISFDLSFNCIHPDSNQVSLHWVWCLFGSYIWRDCSLLIEFLINQQHGTGGLCNWHRHAYSSSRYYACTLRMPSF